MGLSERPLSAKTRTAHFSPVGPPPQRPFRSVTDLGIGHGMADGAPPWRAGRPTSRGSESVKAEGGSGRNALVVMMQPTDLWKLNHAASVGGLDLPELWAIHLQ